jgi:hypothetical protein
MAEEEPLLALVEVHMAAVGEERKPGEEVDNESMGMAMAVLGCKILGCCRKRTEQSQTAWVLG